jgi:hypothetical protein
MADLIYAAVLEKFTGEQFNETFDFDGTIPESTTVVTAAVTVTKSDGTDATSTVYVSKSISSDVVTVTLRSGSEETAYLVHVSVAASDTTPAVLNKLLNVTAHGLYR